MTYKEYGATIAPSNVSSTGFPIAMGTHIGGGRIVNNKTTLNSKQWCLLGEGATLNDQKANAIGQIWYDISDNKYWKLDSWASTNPVWVDVSTIFATTSYVDIAIENIPDPMIFKGSLGTGGTITSLPSVSTSNIGFTYKVITAETYAGQVAKVGDTFISDGTIWNLIPSGDEPGGTVTSITLNATSPILIDNSNAITTSGTRTFSHANTSGNKHIPSGGNSNNYLKWDSDGTAIWSTLPTASTSVAGITTVGTSEGAASYVHTHVKSDITDFAHNHDTAYLGISSQASDSDKLDGQQGSYYLDWTNITNKPNPSITLTGDVTGSGTMTDLNNVSFVTTIGDDSHSHTDTTISGLDGTKITTGTISYLRLPMGTSTNTVAYGNHLHTDIYQPHDTDLDAIAGLVGPGLLRRELNNTWNLDTTTYTSNVGTVTSVVAGAGLNFTTFSNSGSIVLGTPSTITSTTTNSVSGTTHAHALTLAKVDIVALGIPESDTTYTFATGTTNGTFNVTPSGGSLTPISIYGLGSAAYTSSGDYATSAHTHGDYATSAHTHGNISSVGAIGTTSDLMVKTSTSGVLTTLASGSSGQFLQYDGTWATPPNVTTSINGFMSTTDKIKLDGLLSSASATLPATIGWYRIATSTVGIARCSARFEIDWTVSGIHGQVTLNAGIMYGSDPTLNMIQYVHYHTESLSQARIVYHTTYAGNYAYLEVYNSGANALVVNVQMLSSLGWTLITPSTVGSIPSGYTSQTLTFVDGIVTKGQLVSSISTGTAPLVVNSTTKVVNLNSDRLDDKEASDFSNSSDSFNFDASIEPTQTTTLVKTHLWSIQYLLQGIKWLKTEVTNYIRKTGGVLTGDLDPEEDNVTCLGGGSVSGKAWKLVKSYIFQGDLRGKLETPININGVSVDLSQDVTIPTGIDSFNFDANVEPTQTGTSSRTHLWSIQYALQGLKYVYTLLKGLLSTNGRVLLGKMQNREPYINGGSIIGSETDTVIDWRAGANITITPGTEINGLRPVTIAATGGGNIDLSQLTNGFIPKWNATNGLFNNSVICEKGEKVGIGTDNPLSILDITYNDNNYNAGVSVTNLSTGSSALPGINVKDSSKVTQAQFSYVPTNYANPALQNIVLFNSVYKGVSMGFVSSSSGGGSATYMGNIFFQTGPSIANRHLFISGATGYIGMGNTSPAEKLDVVGNIKLTGKLIEKTYGNITTLVAFNSIITLMNSNVANAYYFRIAPADTPTFSLTSLTSLISNYEYSLILQVEANSSPFYVTDSISPRIVNSNASLLFVSVKFRKIGTQVIFTHWQVIL